MEALTRSARARARIRLTYTHTRAFLDLYGAALPASARGTAEAYLATERLPWPVRVLTVQKKGFVMQSPITRLGQIFFG